MKRKISSLVAVLCLISLLVGCGESFRAAEYVEANLHLIFQGETEEAQTFITASDAELEQMYENGIYAFVVSYLTGGIDEDGSYADLFVYLMKEVFRAMKYQVGVAEPIDESNYEVSVTYQPVDMFPKFVDAIKAVSVELENKKAAGEYMGTEQEQSQMMFIEYLQTSYDILEKAYLNMEYGEEKTFVFHVKKNSKNFPELDEKEINQFIESILALDML